MSVNPETSSACVSWGLGKWGERAPFALARVGRWIGDVTGRKELALEEARNPVP